jgi:hypothetical protein
MTDARIEAARAYLACPARMPVDRVLRGRLVADCRCGRRLCGATVVGWPVRFPLMLSTRVRVISPGGRCRRIMIVSSGVWRWRLVLLWSIWLKRAWPGGRRLFWLS